MNDEDKRQERAVPVIEEELVLQKRLVLKEEIYVKRHRTEIIVTKNVTLGREVATVERLDADGRVVEQPRTVQPARPLRTEPAPLIPEPAPLLRVKKGLLD